MSDCYVNIRFGIRHFQIHRNSPYFTFNVNDYHVKTKPKKWFEIYECYGINWLL